jgi:hypothetical protein
MDKKLAYKANRDGVSERFPAPAVHKSLAVDLALLDHYDQLLRDVELSILTTAKQHNANPLYLLRTVPGIGEILSLVLLYEIMTSSASPASKMSSPIAVSSNVSRHRRGNATAPRGARSAMPISQGRSRKRPCSFYAPILRARSISPAWRKHMARARRCPSWLIHEPERCTPCYSAKRPLLCTSFSISRERSG